MRELILSRYKSRFDSIKGKKQKLDVQGYQWAQVVELLSDFKATSETFAEYEAWGKSGDKDDSIKKLCAKDVGYFVGGEFDPPLRSTFNLVARDLLTLDADHLQFMDEAEFKETYGKYTYHIHSSHSHGPDKPRLRIVFPFSRPVTPEEYEPIARMVANMLHMDMFDDTTYQFSRVMFLPSVAADGETYLETNEGVWLDPDKILSLYEDWEDVGSWPRSSRQQTLRAPTMQAQNPFTKPGIIGAFNRAYPIDEAIIKFELQYVESGQGDGRYSYLDGSSADGAIYYPDDGHLFSHHESDPAQGNHNAWDLVRLHRFGDDTEGATNVMQCPSMQQMVLLADSDPLVQAELVGDMFEDCTSEAEADEAEGSTISSVPAQPKVKALTFDDIAQWISDCYNTPDSSLNVEMQEFFTKVAIANLGVTPTEQLVGLFQEYLKKIHGTRISKAGLMKDIASKGKDLVSRGTDGADLKDIQLEFLKGFLAKYYDEGRHLKRTGKAWWAYTGTHWAIRSEEYISGQLAGYLGELRTDPTMRKESAALAAALGETTTSAMHSSLWNMFQATTTFNTESTGVEHDPMGLMRTSLPHAINCKNGTIRFNKKGQFKLFPSKPEDLFTSVIDVDFDPDADCPNWMMFCQSAFSKSSDASDMQRHLEELFGYTCNQARDLRAWVLLYGGTGTGKSTAGKVLDMMLGESAKNMSMANYGGNNSHATAGLVGKMAVLDDDYSMGQLLNDGFLKSVSEEKRLEANPKGKEEFSFIARVVPYILSNNIPATRDISGALEDRALIFPFSHQIPRADRDSRLPEKLSKELPGILARLVRAYAETVKRGDWLFPTDCTAAWVRWSSQSNPLNIFICECLIEEDGSQVRGNDVWEAYTRWWGEENGTHNTRNMLGRSKFYSNIEQRLGVTKFRHKTDGNVYKGYKLDPKFITEDEF